MSLGPLANSRLFASLSPEDLDALESACDDRRLFEAQALVEQGEPCGELIVVIQGRARSSWRSTDDGLEYAGPEVGPGDDVGLAEVLARSVHPVTLRAVESLRVAVLPAEALAILCEARPAIGATVREALARRLTTGRESRQAVVDLANVIVGDEVLSLLPRAQMQKCRAIPLARHGSVVAVGFVDPGDRAAVEEVQRSMPGVRVRPVCLDAPGFERFFRIRVGPVLDRRTGDTGGPDRWFKTVQGKTFDVKVVEGPSASPSADEKGRQIAGEQIIALMNRLIGEAIDLGASDIHIEPSENESIVRFRVDGRLKRRPGSLEPRFHAPLVSRIKVLGHMDIAERRKAQDGRLAILHNGREIDFRLATVPTRFGEKVVLRLLDPSSVLIDLERLVTHEQAYQSVRWMIDHPQGMVIVAGPTGSGKTTTIYSATLRLREDEINIVTIEDPIEYTIEGTTQVQVNETAGVTFANAVRHFLRQDPDVIVVGETRDPVTAATSVEAALTGHLVLTTLHANDALGTVVRLREMGVEPFLLAHTLVGVISQRLVRRVCPHCRERVPYHSDLIRPLGVYREEPAGGFSFFRGRGCVRCNFQGFRGRVGAFEVLRVDDQLRPRIASGDSLPLMSRTCRDAGILLPMSEYCRHLLDDGLTTPEEVTRVLFAER